MRHFTYTSFMRTRETLKINRIWQKTAKHGITLLSQIAFATQLHALLYRKFIVDSILSVCDLYDAINKHYALKREYGCDLQTGIMTLRQ